MWSLLNEPLRNSKELRTAFVSTLQEMMSQNPKIIAMDADLGGASGFLKIKKSHPSQFIEAGIAEANMIGTAAGMSMRGFIPFVHSFAPFVSRRVADQIFMAGAYSHNTLNIYASDPGVCAATNGGTHTAFEDLGFMLAIPNALVFDPADSAQLEWLIRELAELKGIHYIRATRKSMPSIYAPDSSFEIGKGNVIREGSDVLFIAIGELLSEALIAADLLDSDGISAEVIDMFTVKPLDRELIIKRVKGKKLIVSCENHSIINGLGSAVANVLAEEALNIPLKRIGVNDRFGQVGSLTYLKKAYGLTSDVIAATVHNILTKQYAMAAY